GLCIWWKPFGNMGLKPAKIHGLVHDQCRHACATLCTWYSDAVDDRLFDPREKGNRFFDFQCRDVLALPAQRIADAIDKIPKTLFVLSHQIARAIPGIAGCEDIS